MKKIGIIIFALLLSCTMFAQGKIEVQAPNLVAVDEQFNVSFSIEGDSAPSDFSWNCGDDFKLVWGPQKGSSTSISIINGKRSKSSQTTYTYVLLPRKTGTFTLAPATANLNGSRISSGTKSIQVVSNGASASQSSGSGSSSSSSGSSSQKSSGSQATTTGTISSDDLFLRLNLSRNSAVMGETITATLKLYQRVNIAGFEDAKFPTFDGFWSQEVQAPTNIEFHRESLGDKIYNTAVLRSWNLIPQKSGDIVIDPAELVCLVNVRQASSGTGSIFDSFFQDEYRTIRKRVSTPAITVHVSGLPAGAPASFGGGVGNFSMKAELSCDSLKTHDAASLKINITGNGNIALLEAPKVNFPPDFEVYDVKTSDGAHSKTFEYPFIPRSYGNFEIGPIEYSYYDVSAGQYVTLRSEVMPLKVIKSKDDDIAASTDGQLVQSANRKDVKNLGSDIRFISTKTPRLSAAGNFFVWSPLFCGIAALLVLLAVLAYFLLRRMESRRADVVGSRNRGAVKMARGRLSQAKDYLGKGLYTAFYESLHKALLGYVGDKLNIDAADQSKENISAKLSEAGVPEASVAEFVSLLDACEFARYAPDSGTEAMNSHYESAVNVISQIDSSMKRKPKTIASAAPLLLLMLLPVQAKASDYTDSLWTAGTEAYTQGLWQEAYNNWTEIVNLGEVSASLYYNIGNAAFKQGELGTAILNYERSLKLNPSYSDARYNLEFAQSMTQDKIDAVPEFFLKGWMRKLGWSLPSNAWAVIALVFLAATLFFALMFLLSSTGKKRKMGFYFGIVSLLIGLIALILASWQRRESMASDKAIITKSVTLVKSSPGGGEAKDLFILHEGTKVKRMDEVGKWSNIELLDGRQGWILSEDFEKI